MVIIFGMIQGGIWLHARNVAAEAAHAAADVARNYHGDAGRARQVAYKITAVGGLQHVSVQVLRGQHSVTVNLSGRAPVLLDLGLARVTGSASAPIERVTP